MNVELRFSQDAKDGPVVTNPLKVTSKVIGGVPVHGAQVLGKQLAQLIEPHFPSICIAMLTLHTENAPRSASGIVKHKAVFASRTGE